MLSGTLQDAFAAAVTAHDHPSPPRAAAAKTRSTRRARREDTAEEALVYELMEQETVRRGSVSSAASDVMLTRLLGKTEAERAHRTSLRSLDRRTAAAAASPGGGGGSSRPASSCA
eukprot:6922850-Prymnesium_polylepis.1